MNEKLKSCPFCGSEPEIVMTDNGKYFFVDCVSKDCKVSPMTFYRME